MNYIGTESVPKGYSHAEFFVEGSGHFYVNINGVQLYDGFGSPGIVFDVVEEKPCKMTSWQTSAYMRMKLY